MRTIPLWFGFIFIGWVLGMGMPAHSAQTQATPAVNVTPQRSEVKIGAYLTSLYDINQSRGTFSADLWVWALSNPKSNYKIEEALEINYISNEFPRTFSGYYTEPVTPDVKIEQRKIQGVFLHDFDMENFPFDKQRLKISFEDSSNDLTKWCTPLTRKVVSTLPSPSMMDHPKPPGNTRSQEQQQQFRGVHQTRQGAVFAHCGDR